MFFQQEYSKHRYWTYFWSFSW